MLKGAKTVINKECAMVKIDYEGLLNRYRRAVIIQDKIYMLSINGYGFDENIKDIDKEVKYLEAQLLERLRRDERRDEVNNDIEVLYTFGTYAEVK